MMLNLFLWATLMWVSSWLWPSSCGLHWYGCRVGCGHLPVDYTDVGVELVVAIVLWTTLMWVLSWLWPSSCRLHWCGCWVGCGHLPVDYTDVGVELVVAIVLWTTLMWVLSWLWPVPRSLVRTTTTELQTLLMLQKLTFDCKVLHPLGENPTHSKILYSRNGAVIIIRLQPAQLWWTLIVQPQTTSK